MTDETGGKPLGPIPLIAVPDLAELRARVEKAEADAAQWKAVAELNLVSWTKQSVRAWGHDLTRESLTELLAAAEECAGDLATKIGAGYSILARIRYPEIAHEYERDMAPVRRLRAAVEKVRGE